MVREALAFVVFQEGVVAEGRSQKHILHLDHLGLGHPSHPKNLCWAHGPQDSGDGQHSAL